MVFIFVLFALLADFIAPYPYALQNRQAPYHPPTRIHFFKDGKPTLPYVHKYELKEEAQQVSYIAGPLGRPFPVKNYGKVACFGIGWGIAPLYNVAKFLKAEGNSLELYFVSEDGFLPLRERLDALFNRVEVLKEPKRVDADLIISAGGNRLSRDVLKLNPETPHIAMVNTHMLDAVGLCLVCRVLVDGAVKLACSDGPWFDAQKVDWENLIRGRTFLQNRKG